MGEHANILQWIMGSLLILSALGVILSRKPLYSALSFLFSLIMLAAFYLQLSAEFIAVMQVLIYAGAILVIFVFVIVLFQDAHQQIADYASKVSPQLLVLAGFAFSSVFAFWGWRFMPLVDFQKDLPQGFGVAEGIGHALYLNFFFPFEAVILLFLIAIVGSLYIAKKEK